MPIIEAMPNTLNILTAKRIEFIKSKIFLDSDCLGFKIKVFKDGVEKH